MKKVMERGITIEPPKELNMHTVVKWSTSFKRIEEIDAEGKVKTFSLRSKAKRFLMEECIEYDKEKKCYLCKPIKGYNKTTYEMYPKAGQFNCSCQFHNNVVMRRLDIPGLVCSHVLALKLFLKIWNWNQYGPPKDSYTTNSSKLDESRRS